MKILISSLLTIALFLDFGELSKPSSSHDEISIFDCHPRSSSPSKDDYGPPQPTRYIRDYPGRQFHPIYGFLREQTEGYSFPPNKVKVKSNKDRSGFAVVPSDLKYTIIGNRNEDVFFIHFKGHNFRLYSFDRQPATMNKVSTVVRELAKDEVIFCNRAFTITDSTLGIHCPADIR